MNMKGQVIKILEHLQFGKISRYDMLHQFWGFDPWQVHLEIL